MARQRDLDDTESIRLEGIVHILLVEDNPGDARLTREAFRDCVETIQLHVVRDGEEALDFLYQRKKHVNAPAPNMVLLDINLPGMNGLEVLAEIKKDSLLKRIPVVMLTTSKADEDITRAYELHANCFLTKPVDLEKFMQTVRSLEAFWFGIAELPGGRAPGTAPG
jgi:CheY-like chemotaxis protein